MPLSEKLARRISEETGVATEWLLKNDLNSHPFTPAGKPFTKKSYEKHRAKLHGGKIDPAHFAFAQFRLVQYLHRLVEIMVAAHGLEKLGVACHRIDKALERIEKDLGVGWDGGNKPPPTDRDVPVEIMETMRPGVAVPARFIFDKFNGSLLLEFQRQHKFKGDSKEFSVECLNGRVIRAKEFLKNRRAQDF